MEVVQGGFEPAPPPTKIKKTVKNGLLVEAAGFSPKVNILTLAAYERARRALRGECEPNSRAGKMRTNISNKPSANIVKMREVCSRPRRLRQNEKKTVKNGLLVEAAGLEPTVSSTRNWRDTTFATPRKKYKNNNKGSTLARYLRHRRIVVFYRLRKSAALTTPCSLRFRIEKTTVGCFVLATFATP